MTDQTEVKGLCPYGVDLYSAQQKQNIQNHQQSLLNSEHHPDVCVKRNLEYLGFVNGLIYGSDEIKGKERTRLLDVALSPDTHYILPEGGHPGRPLSLFEFEGKIRHFIDEHNKECSKDLSLEAFATYKLATHPNTQNMEFEDIMAIVDKRCDGGDAFNALIDELYIRPTCHFDTRDLEWLKDKHVLEEAKQNDHLSHKIDKHFLSSTLRTKYEPAIPQAMVDAIAQGYKASLAADGVDIEIMDANHTRLRNLELACPTVAPAIDFYYKQNGVEKFAQIHIVDLDPEHGANITDYKPPVNRLVMNHHMYSSSKGTDGVPESNLICFGMTNLGDYMQIGKTIGVNDHAMAQYLIDTVVTAIKSDSKNVFLADSKIVFNNLESPEYKQQMEQAQKAFDACTMFYEQYIKKDTKPSLLRPPSTCAITDEQMLVAEKKLANYAFNQQLNKKLSKSIQNTVDEIKEIESIDDKKIDAQTCQSISREYWKKPDEIIKIFEHAGVNIEPGDITYKVEVTKAVIDNDKLMETILESGIAKDDLKNLTCGLRIKTNTIEYKETYAPIMDQLVDETIKNVQCNHYEVIARMDDEQQQDHNHTLQATSNIDELGYEDEAISPTVGGM